MPKNSPSQAKNLIRRSLRAVVDPYPSNAALESLWQHFESRCAYCGTHLQPDAKQAHYDHLVAKSNHLGNFVLACARCNEHEKREINWRAFLRRKAVTAQIYETRLARVVAWQKLHRKNRLPINPSLLDCAEKSIRRVIRVYDNELRTLRLTDAQGRVNSSKPFT